MSLKLKVQLMCKEVSVRIFGTGKRQVDLYSSTHEAIDVNCCIEQKNVCKFWFDESKVAKETTISLKSKDYDDWCQWGKSKEK